MRIRSLTVASIAAAAACVMAPAAHAQSTPTGGFQLDRYVLPMQANDLFWTERPSISPHLHVGVIAAIGYQRAPLTVRRTDQNRNTETATLVENDLRGHVGVGVGLFDRAQVGVALPVVLYTQGEMQPGGGSVTHTALGDLRADLRMRLLGANTGAGARLAIAGSIFLPIGNPAAYAGDGYVTGSVRALLEYELPGGVRLDLNAGVLFRPTLVFTRDYNYTVDDEGFARLGVMVPMTRARNLLATLEVAGATALAYAPGVFDRYYSHLELLTGAKYVTDGGAFIGIAGGVGLSPGVGTPDARAIVMVGRGYTDPVPNGAGIGDTDQDGVINVADRCATVPMGTHPDPDRPGCPSQDDDRDGYINQLDNCPHETAGAHPDLERVGCPLRDADSDGVFDARDLCPNQARGETPDGARLGCPMLAPAEIAAVEPSADRGEDAVRDQQLVIREPLYFAANRDRILPRSFPMLQEIVQTIASRPDIRLVRIEGHTDRRGSLAHNMRLSAQRAASVREWLIARGIAADRLTSEGFGPTRPVVDDVTPEGRARNRRVEFHIVNLPPVAAGRRSPNMNARAGDPLVETTATATASATTVPAATAPPVSTGGTPPEPLNGVQ